MSTAYPDPTLTNGASSSATSSTSPSTTSSSSANNNQQPQQRYVAPDFKRRQLLFDSFTKLGAAGVGVNPSKNDTSSIPPGTAASSGNGSTSLSSTLTAPLLSSSTAAATSANGNTPSIILGAVSEDIGPKGTLLYTWGAGYHGQLGLNTFRKKCRMVPACIEFGEPVINVACGGFHTAVLTDEGKVYTWGDGRYGQNGNLARKHNMHSTPHLVDWLVTYRISIIHIACGQYHTAAVSNGGKLYTWGSGKWGQLGHGVRLDERFPRKVEIDRRSACSFIRVACGDRHTVVLSDQGQVVTFGSGQHGQLGHGNGSDQLRPVMMSEVNENGVENPLAKQCVVMIECGATTTACVTSTGLFYLCGFGESIHPKGCSNIQDTPRLIHLNETIKSVACGQGHILILTDGGDVYSFGQGGMGQLGHGARSNVRTPRLILKGKEIHHIAAGRYHSMAVSGYGILYSWGCSESGQGGHNSLECEVFPRVISTILPNVVGAISCGEHHSFALTSIAHLQVAPDIQNWMRVETEELRRKNELLFSLPNGLKSKHILQIEQERRGIIKKLGEEMKKEREENQEFAELQMSLIRTPNELVEDVWRLRQEALERGDAEMLSQVHAMNQQARRLMLNNGTTADVAMEREGRLRMGMRMERNGGLGVSQSAAVLSTNATTADTILHSGQHSHRSMRTVNQHQDGEGGMNGELNEQQFDHPHISHHRSQHASANSSPARRKRQLQQSASELTLQQVSSNNNPQQQNHLSSIASSPDLLYSQQQQLQEEKEPLPVNTNNSFRKKPHQLSSLNGSTGSGTKRAMSSSASQPVIQTVNNSNIGLASSASQKQLAPIIQHRPGSASGSVKMNATEHHTESHQHHQHQQQSSNALIEYAPSTTVAVASTPFSSTSTQPYSLLAAQFTPLAPRLSYAEQQHTALTWVRDMISAQPESEQVITTNVIKLQKQYNLLKAGTQQRKKRIEKLKNTLALYQPSSDEETGTQQSTERIKSLNMKLVTLSTRLMESEENKRNYELYIIRMKEEDLQLSKQIEHLRQLVTEYDRLLLKVSKMSIKVLEQKSEIHTELTNFQEDIAEFMDFTEVTLEKYRRVLGENERMYEKEMNGGGGKGQQQVAGNAAASENTHSSRLNSASARLESEDLRIKMQSYQEKLDYYTERFKKLSSSTGLTKSDQIISKHYFNAEITQDLKYDIEMKQDRLLELQEEFRKEEAKLAQLRKEYIPIRWRDYGQLEENNVNAIARLLRSKSESESWRSKLTRVEEGMRQLLRTVRVGLEENEMRKKEQKEQEEKKKRQEKRRSQLSSSVVDDEATAADNEDHHSPADTAEDEQSHAFDDMNLSGLELEKAVETQITSLLRVLEEERKRMKENRIVAAAEAGEENDPVEQEEESEQQEAEAQDDEEEEEAQEATLQAALIQQQEQTTSSSEIAVQ